MTTLQELVKKRIGYKFLNANGESPYKHYKYDLTHKKQMITVIDEDEDNDCGEGWNLATLKWIADNCLKLDGIIVEWSIPPKAKIVVPKKSTGKFRTDIIKIKKVYKIESLYPALKDIRQRLYNYIPQNPITAETMPEQSKIKKILAQVRDQVWDQVRDQVGAQVRDQVGAQVRDQGWDQVWAQVWAQVGAQVGDQVWDQGWAQVRDQVGAQVWAQVRDQVWDQVGAQVRAQVRDQVWAQVEAQVWDQVRDQVWDQVRDQVWVCAYHAVKVFLNLDYDHPAFDLIRLGIIVVNVSGVFKVFGKGGKYLGDLD